MSIPHLVLIFTNISGRYNKVDGSFCCDSETLIEDILRKEWGYKGIVMSDWFGTRSTVASMKAGVDVEMPVPVFRGERLIKAVESGEVSEEVINASVSRLLDLRNRVHDGQSRVFSAEFCLDACSEPLCSRVHQGHGRSEYHYST